jgi:uncharacterized RDD family membrane protein YckC
MMCPRCGDDCHCDGAVRPNSSVNSGPRFLPQRFQADAEVCLIDPEAFEPSEQAFSGSLSESASEQYMRFVPNAPSVPVTVSEIQEERSSKEEALPSNDAVPSALNLCASTAEKPAPTAEDPDAWRREVAARLDRYRSRRKVAEPRYPSLRLKFDPPEQTWNDISAIESVEAPSSLQTTTSPVAVTHCADRQSGARDRFQPEPVQIESPVRIEEVVQPEEIIEPTAKIIEFPRSYTAPVRTDELADPVIDRPRIVEAPEMLPPPPAMGGILMAPEEAKEPERRPGFEMPLRSAPLGRRIFAAAIDLAIVASAGATFGTILDRLGMPPLSPVRLAEDAIGVTVILWAIYQYMLLVYNGSTPGLRAARLQLRRFDGRPVPRRMRRWRVLTSVLSGLSLGMGYAWCFLDEDALCWHDRITHTYLEPKPKKSNPVLEAPSRISEATS